MVERRNCTIQCGNAVIGIDQVVRIAKLADKAILDVYNAEDSTWNVIQKEDELGPLTRADTEANEIIVAELNKLSPSIPIVSEEGDAIPWERRRIFEYFWSVDPLDGTKEFIKRNGQFTVNIGLCHKDTPIAGVVTVPVQGTCYYAVQGNGAYKETVDETGRKVIQCIKAASFEESHPGLTIVGNSSINTEQGMAFIKKYKDPIVKRMGSSLKMLMLAEGSAHVYPRFWPTCEWDTAAAHAILAEAGGCVLQTGGGAPANEGQQLVYNKENLLNPFFVAYAAKK